MIRCARLLGLILALLLAPPLEAADPPDYEAVLLELDPRLAELANGEEGLLQIAQAVQAYMETRVPRTDEAAKRAFTANLKARINAMSAAELDDLAFRAARQTSAAEQTRGNESAFHDKLDAVAFYTVASQAVMEDMTRRVAEIARTGEKPQTPTGVALSRDPAGHGPVAEVVGIGGRRSLRLVHRAMTGGGTPAETTPWTRIAPRRLPTRPCSPGRPGSTRSKWRCGSGSAGSSRS